MIRPPNKKGTRKEVKLVVIDNSPLVIDLDTKVDLESPTQSAVVMQQYDPTRPEVRKVSSHLHPTTRLPPKPLDIVSTDTTSKKNLGTDLNSPHQEGIIMEMYEIPDKSYIQQPQNLADMVNPSNLVQKYLPKQVDIDKIFDVIKGEVLKTSANYNKGNPSRLFNPAIFQGLYRYLAQNKLPNKKSAICKIEALSEKYILLDSLLFKIILDKEKALLAMPETCVDKIITLYLATLFTGHQGVIKTYLTISDKFLYQT